MAICPIYFWDTNTADAVRRGAGAQPVVFPLADSADIETLISHVDGVLLTGSPSNVHPLHYGQELADPGLPMDPIRDNLTLPLVHACLERGVPLLGICRGFQEINVALGGTLHQQVHGVHGLNDHRENDQIAIAERYALSHTVRIDPDSDLALWAQGPVVRVNSLHGQGIDRLAQPLRPLAWAEDGLVEAYEVQGTQSFAMAVQWHPEWRFWENQFFAALFARFGHACRARQSLKTSIY